MNKTSLRVLTDLRCLASLRFQSTVANKLWQVSSHGRVCNTRGGISNGSLTESGYCKVKIAGMEMFVHRIVAFTFLGPCPDQQAWQVHHRDGNRSNNRLENLEYATPSQNISWSYANNSRRNAGPKLSIPVIWRAVGSQSWTTSPSMTQAAAELGVSQFSVQSGCRQGRPAKGYEFQLAFSEESLALDGEEWRQMCDPMSGTAVPGRLVSSLGRIKSRNGRVSCGYLKEGYCRTSVRMRSQCRAEYVHRLVAFAFLGPPADPKCSHVNHKDLDKSNNSVRNLEYVTPSENILHSWRNGSRRPRQEGKLVESRHLGRNDDEWELHPAIQTAAERLKVYRTAIYHCLAGRQRHTGGFEFRLAKTPAKTCGSESLAGEEWRNVDVQALLQERFLRENIEQVLPRLCADRGTLFRALPAVFRYCLAVLCDWVLVKTGILMYFEY